MKQHIINFFKMLWYGIVPAIAGGCITMDVMHAIRNARQIMESSGWIVVYHFLLMVAEIILAVLLLYELGVVNYNSNNWKKHLQNNEQQSENNTNVYTSSDI